MFDGSPTTDDIADDFKLLCTECDTYITKWSSCDCGRTAVELLEIQMNNDELDQRYN